MDANGLWSTDDNRDSFLISIVRCVRCRCYRSGRSDGVAESGIAVPDGWLDREVNFGLILGLDDNAVCEQRKLESA